MSEKEEQELKILEFMKDKDYVPMKAKEIAMIMRVPKKEYRDFLEVLGNFFCLHWHIILVFDKL